MGSVRFYSGDELHPCTYDGQKSMSSENFLLECGAVNYAAVPRMLRSAIKTRARESIMLPSPIIRKKRCSSKRDVKKSRLIMVTKEEEVAETLTALADMFSYIANTDNPVLPAAEVQEEAGTTNTSITLDFAKHSMEKVENFQSLDDAEQHELEFGKQTAISRISRVQLYLSIGPRPKMPGPDMIQSCERMIVQDQVSASDIPYSKYHCNKEDKYKGLSISRSLSSTEIPSSKIHGSCSAFPALFESTSSSTQPSAVENNFVADKVVQESETTKGLMTRPTQLNSSGNVEQQLHTSIDNQKRRGSEFVSLASSEGIIRPGYGLEASKQFHESYKQLQNYSAMLFSIPQNRYSSMFSGHSSPEAASQVKLPAYCRLNSQQAQYCPGQQPGWQNSARDLKSLLNYVQALFPHLHPALGSKDQCFAPPPLFESNIERQYHLHHPPLFESNIERYNHRHHPAF